MHDTCIWLRCHVTHSPFELSDQLSQHDLYTTWLSYNSITILTWHTYLLFQWINDALLETHRNQRLHFWQLFVTLGLLSLLQVDRKSKARDIAIFCPFWVLNKTDVDLVCKDKSLHAHVPQHAPPAAGGTATPLLFSSRRGSVSLRVSGGSWSPSINLDKTGAGYSLAIAYRHGVKPGGKSNRVNIECATSSLLQCVLHRGTSGLWCCADIYSQSPAGLCITETCVGPNRTCIARH